MRRIELPPPLLNRCDGGSRKAQEKAQIAAFDAKFYQMRIPFSLCQAYPNPVKWHRHSNRPPRCMQYEQSKLIDLVAIGPEVLALSERNLHAMNRLLLRHAASLL